MSRVNHFTVYILYNLNINKINGNNRLSLSDRSCVILTLACCKTMLFFMKHLSKYDSSDNFNSNVPGIKVMAEKINKFCIISVLITTQYYMELRPFKI